VKKMVTRSTLVDTDQAADVDATDGELTTHDTR
jgi:hypothetical protein